MAEVSGPDGERGDGRRRGILWGSRGIATGEVGLTSSLTFRAVHGRIS
ncbi:hypothetical protein IG631_03010 [Alternaria alternata]|nr:hypothetical protein IG631_03010 [Alternaria alternata]